MEIEYIDINKIIPYENNPRINVNAVDKVAESIKEFGFKQPIVLDENNIIVVGHTRLEASKKLNINKVPCIRAIDLDEQQIKAYRLADNKTNEFAEWDIDKLKEELEGLENEFTGFDEEEINTLFKNLENNDNNNNDNNNDNNNYTKKIKSPVYEKTREEQPKLNELFDTNITKKLIKKIDKSKINSEIKEFLKYAAYRHIVFNYENIAEYYTHAEKEIQELIEDSLLVIVDYNKAIENGLIEFNKEIFNCEDFNND